MSEQPILTIERLSAGYGRSQVLFDVSMSARPVGAVAILGRNGVGKTTLLKTIAGEIAPMSGEITFDGEEWTRTPTEQRVRGGLGYVPQEHAIFGSLTVEDNLALGAAAHKSPIGKEMVLDIFPKLGGRLKQQAGTLSGGERKMLAIGRALLGRPRMLMLDEPTEGVWIGVIEEISDQLRKLAGEICLIIVEQHVELALHVADYAYVMDRGTIALEGHADAVRTDERLLRYLAP